jgi:hypothetical protein
MTMNGLSSALSDLFRSHHTRFLEAELLRQRVEYQAAIRELREENHRLLDRIEKYMMALNPALERVSPEYQARKKAAQSTAEFGGPLTWSEALVRHNEVEFAEEDGCQPQRKYPNASGLVDAER